MAAAGSSGAEAAAAARLEGAEEEEETAAAAEDGEEDGSGAGRAAGAAAAGGEAGGEAGGGESEEEDDVFEVEKILDVKTEGVSTRRRRLSARRPRPLPGLRRGPQGGRAAVRRSWRAARLSPHPGAAARAGVRPAPWGAAAGLGAGLSRALAAGRARATASSRDVPPGCPPLPARRVRGQTPLLCQGSLRGSCENRRSVITPV